jgi:hypothetical protein
MPDTEAEREFRKLLADIIKKSGKPRAKIAEDMRAALGGEITKDKLNEFVRSPRPGRVMRFPAAWARAFCDAVGSDELARFLLSESDRRAVRIAEHSIAAEDHLRRALELVALANEFKPCRTRERKER